MQTEITLTERQQEVLITAAITGYAAISVDAPAPAEQDVQENPELSEDAENTAENAGEIVEAAPEPAPEPDPETSTKKPRKMRAGTKQATIIEMLQREEGASLQQIMEATGWQMHTTRAVLSRTIQKDLGIPLTSEKTSGGDRIYRIA